MPSAAVERAIERAIGSGAGLPTMRVGGKRRILVSPALDFTNVPPQPTSAAAGKRLKTVENKPFLEILRIRRP